MYPRLLTAQLAPSKNSAPASDHTSSRKAPQDSDRSTISNSEQSNKIHASNSLKAAAQKRARSFSTLPPGFALPTYEPDLEQAIKSDSFYNPHKRAKLIRKSCEALAGYCRENEMPVTTELKSHLAKALVQLAPKSLSDDGKLAVSYACTRGWKSAILICCCRMMGRKYKSTSGSTTMAFKSGYPLV